MRPAALAVLLLTPLAAAQETVFFHADRPVRRFANRTGFLHGRDDNGSSLDPERISPLQPAEWRVSKLQGLQDAREFGAKITFVLSDSYAWQHGGYQTVNVWEDWDGWEAYVVGIMDWMDANNFHIDWWDPWNEPDHPYFWHGTYEQSLELFARSINVIKAHDPDARVVGPSISWFRDGNGGEEDLTRLIKDLDQQHGVRFDAISWHENGGPAPNQIAVNAQTIRQSLEDHFPGDYQPQLHVNEFAGTQEHLSPGWNVGYLFWLEAANVDASMRACWNVRSIEDGEWSNWSDCWDGLNGLLMRDNSTPTHTWWLHREWASFEGEILAAGVPNATTVGLATLGSEGKHIHAIVARFDKGFDAALRIVVEGYAHPEVDILIQRIPNNEDYDLPRPIVWPLPDGPAVYARSRQSVISGRIDILIPDAPDGDAFIIHARPPDPRIPRPVGPHP